MGRQSTRFIFRIAQAAVPAAQELDPLLHIENADAVALQLGGGSGVVAEHGFHPVFFSRGKARTGVADLNLHLCFLDLQRGYLDKPLIALIFQAMKQTVFHNGLQNEVGHQDFRQVRVDIVFHL